VNRTRHIAASLVLMLALAACSSRPEKKDEDVLKSDTKTEKVPSADDLMKKDVETEDVPTASDLEGSGKLADASASKKVDSGVASDIRSAIEDARKGDKDSAASDLASLVDRPDGGYLAAYNLGVVRERQGLYDKAARRYFQAVQKNPDFTPALENLVRLYLRQERASDAERIVRKFIDARPDNLGHRAVMLQIDLYRGNYEDVITKAKHILRKDERHVGAMIALAEANFQLGRYELAKYVISAAVELEPERAELYNTFGLVELRLDDTAAAMANFRKAIEQQPQYPEAHNNLGVLYHDARDFESAVDEFKAAVRDYPDFKQAYLNLGNAFKGLKRYKDAELAFRKAIEIDDDYADAHYNLGVLYLDSEVPGMDVIERLQKSISQLNRYEELAPKRPKDDPADKYINEAKKQIEVEKQKKEMMRQNQMGAEQTGTNGATNP